MQQINQNNHKLLGCVFSSKQQCLFGESNFLTITKICGLSGILFLIILPLLPLAIVESSFLTTKIITSVVTSVTGLIFIFTACAIFKSMHFFKFSHGDKIDTEITLHNENKIEKRRSIGIQDGSL